MSLVAARIWLGRGAALGAALFFLAMRGLMALLVGPGARRADCRTSRSTSSRRSLVELIALRVRRPLPFALAVGRRDRHRRAGRRVGLDARLHAVAVAGRAGCPRASLLGLAMALAGALRRRLDRRAAERPTATPSLRPAAVLAAVAIFALTGYGAAVDAASQGVRGDGRADAAGEGTVNAEVRVDPPTAPTTPTG